MELEKSCNVECLYIGTINRHLLDFDLIFACGVCLTVQNVYCCLVCGKYLEGLGVSSHAWLHSLESQHFLFINTKTCEIVSLPECTKVEDCSLSDIKYNLNPEFTMLDIQKIYEQPQQSRSLTGNSFIVGLIPVNNLNTSAYLSSAVYILSNIKEIKNSLVLGHFSGLTEQLSRVLKKMHNKISFKSHICPHELFHIISVLSNGKFASNKKIDPQIIFQWLINHLKQDIHLKSIISQCIEGKLTSKGIKKKFYLLKIDLPTVSPFADSEEFMKLELNDLVDSYLTSQSIEIVRFPKYLILFINKFKHNKFFVEKNKIRVVYDFELKVAGMLYGLINVVALDSDHKDKAFYTNTLHGTRWYQVRDLVVNLIPESQVCQSEAYILVYSIIN